MISRVESCQTWLEHISEPRYFLEALPFNLDAPSPTQHIKCATWLVALPCENSSIE